MRYFRHFPVLIIFVFLFILNAVAADPYANYIYDNNGKVQAEPQAYIPDTIIDSNTIGAKLNGPKDVFVSQDDHVYVLDSGNNRILILNSQFKLLKIISALDNNGHSDQLKNPNGIFVTADNLIYVADTDNARVICIDQNGIVKRVLNKPNTNRFQGNYKYQPMKVAVDSVGRVFVVSQNVSEGMLEYDENGNFMCFFGALKVIVNPMDAVIKLLANCFKGLSNSLILNVPTEYSSNAIDGQGFVYGTVGLIDSSASNVGDMFIHRLNPMGNDVLKRNGIQPPMGDVNQFYDEDDQTEVYSFLCDICVRNNGLYAVLDNRKGRVFTYDHDGNLLYVFGADGNLFGQFGQPEAIDVIHDEDYLVVDSKYNQIDVFKPTEYGKIITSAASDYYNRDYDQANLMWEKAINYTAKSQMVFNGYAKALLQQRNYKQAMKYYKYAQNSDGYSQAFEAYRADILNRYFDLILAVIVLLIAGFFIRSVIKKHKAKKRKVS